MRRRTAVAGASIILAVLAGFGAAAPATLAANLDHLARLVLTKKCPNCDLRSAPLRGENLAGADLRFAHLEHADLHSADLSRARLNRAALFNADLRNANLSGANLKGADLGGASLKGARFCKTTMPDGKVRNDHC